MTEPLDRDTLMALDALGALSGPERERLASLLAGDADGARAHRQAQAVTQALLLAPEALTPSARTKQALMARIAPRAAGASQASQPGLAGGWLRRLGGFAWPALAAAAVAVVLGVQLNAAGVRMAQLETRLAATEQEARQAAADARRIEAELMAANARLTDARAELARLGPALEDARGEASRASAAARTNEQLARDANLRVAAASAELNVILQPGVRSSALAPSHTDFDRGVVTVIYAPQSKTAMLTVANLPALPADKTYQVWLIKGDARLPSVIFNTDASGAARIMVSSEETMGAFGLAGITVEPAGGRPTPNPAGPIFLGKLA